MSSKWRLYGIITILIFFVWLSYSFILKPSDLYRVPSSLQEQSEKQYDKRPSFQWKNKEDKKKKEKKADPDKFERHTGVLSQYFDWGNISEKKKNAEAARDIVIAFELYDKKDRADILDAALLALRSRGIRAIPEVKKALNHIPATARKARYGLIYSLGLLGADLAFSRQKKEIYAREKINDILLSELARKKVKLSRSESQLVDYWHTPGIEKNKGKLYQTFNEAKMTAIYSLGKIGDSLAKETLIEITKSKKYDSNLKQTAMRVLFQISPDDFEEVAESDVK